MENVKKTIGQSLSEKIAVSKFRIKITVIATIVVLVLGITLTVMPSAAHADSSECMSPYIESSSFDGSDFANLGNGVSEEECMAACESLSKCEAITHNSGNNVCFLKNEIPELKCTESSFSSAYKYAKAPLPPSDYTCP